jgi:thioredoxin 1
MRAFALPFALVAVTALSLGSSRPAAADEPAPCAVAFEAGTPSFSEVLAKSKAEAKPVLLDFGTVSCVWCKRLDRDTFSQAEVGTVMKGFVAVRVDAQKGEGPALAKRYGVNGYPTLVVVDANGDEIDRIHGYRKPDPFVAEAKRILAGDGTIPALRRRLAGAPGDVAAGMALGAKLAASRPDEAATLFADLTKSAKDADRATQASLRLEHASALLASGRPEEAVRIAESLVQDFADAPAAGLAAARVGRAFLATDPRRALTFLDAARGLAKQPSELRLVEALTVEIHRAATAAALRRQAKAAGDDPIALNEVAWTSFEQKLLVRDAIGWARRAADASKRDPMILDTLANLLFLEGAREEAIAIEKEAVDKSDGELRRELTVVLARMRAEQEAIAAQKDVPAPAPSPVGGPPSGAKPAEGAAR